MTIGFLQAETMTGVSSSCHRLSPFFRLKMAENDAMTQMTAEKKFLEVKKNKKINAKGCHACHRHPVHTPKSMSAPAWLNPVPPKHELINRYRWTE